MRYSRAAVALFCALVLPALPAWAKPTDYRFELAGPPGRIGGRNLVLLRIVRVADGQTVPDAVIFQSDADMAPAGMAGMTAPMVAVSARDGVYGFAVTPGMTGLWALHMAAKLQGEPETLRGTITASLVQ